MAWPDRRDGGVSVADSKYEIVMAVDDGQLWAYAAEGGGIYLVATSAIGMKGVSLSPGQLRTFIERLQSLYNLTAETEAR